MGRARLDSLNYSDYIRSGSTLVGYATTASVEGDAVVVRHHGSVIATISRREVEVDNAGYDSVTTAHRIDRVLVDNATGARCFIRNGETVVVDAEGVEHRSFPVSIAR
jgi:hypothetical protein